MKTAEDIISINEAIREDDENTLKNRYLTFNIGDEEYAIEIKYVIEIIGIQKITPVPNIRKFIKGIINLRGNIIPVVDVRLRFKMEEMEYNDRTCIIVILVNNNSIGLIVDEVVEVVNIPETEISPPPQTNKGAQSRFISAIGRVENGVKIILNTSKLLYDEIKEISEEKIN
jgi:purine-binding chemotaxis protein CheW